MSPVIRSPLAISLMVVALQLPATAGASGLPGDDYVLSEGDEVFASFTGAAANDRLGHGAAGGGDFNGDGFPDVALAAPGAGEVYVILGGGSFPAVGNHNVLSAADAVLATPATTGAGEHYALGFTDLDNDGRDDLIIGVPFYGSSDVGRVYVVYGRDEVADMDVTTAGTSGGVLTITSPTAQGKLGYAVSGGRDTGGSQSGGVQDLLIGAPGISVAYLIYGKANRPSSIEGTKAASVMVGSTSKGVTFSGSADELGFSVALTPPLTSGQSQGSVLLGAPATESDTGSVDDCGAVYVFDRDGFGDVTQQLSDANTSYTSNCNPGGGPDPFRNGSSVVAALFDNDLYGDIAFGAPLVDWDGDRSANDVGRFWIRFGSSVGSGPDTTPPYQGSPGKPHLSGYRHTLNANAFPEYIGTAAAAADIDGDGLDDLILGTPYGVGTTGSIFSDGGQTYVLLSSESIINTGLEGWVGASSNHTASYLGEKDDDGAGAAVARAGDLFRSGYEAFVVGAPYFDDGGSSSAGRVYVVVPNDAVDQDGDSTTVRGGDCDESSALSRPGLAETCDLRDNDCDGSVDEGKLKTFYYDEDGDGYGIDDADLNIQGCVPEADYAEFAGDCVPDAANINPGAEDVCNTKDDDCDGNVDEGVSTTYYVDGDGDGYGGEAVEACSQPGGTVLVGGDCDDDNAQINPDTEWFLDGDSDGYGDPDFATTIRCQQPSGYVLNDGDCNDDDSAFNPDATEICDGEDNNCDGSLPVDERDADSDGYLSCDTCTGGVLCGDCADGRPAINPGATEVCDEEDNNCNDAVDEGVTTTYFLDGDDDDYGDSGSTMEACTLPDGYAAVGGDCADDDSARNPGLSEICDGKDNDCVGGVPSNESDADGDTVLICAGDCDDTDSEVNNTLTEICDDKDNNCDDEIDEGFDKDFDGFYTCARPSLEYPADCADLDADTYPGAPERCDDIDNDCDGNTDDERLDEDGDGHPACGLGGKEDDCDDTDTSIYPGAPEICDLKDNDCDDLIDDADPDVVGQPTWYADVDADGTRDPDSTRVQCFVPDGYVADIAQIDCDDTDDEVSPLLDEVCDEKDNDCNDAIDEGVQTTYFADTDSDDAGDPDTATEACSPPSPTGWVLNGDDCDDDDPEASPSQIEFCDGKDNDCDELSDEGFDSDGLGGADCVDNDGDGKTELQEDCDDEDSTIYPGADESTQNGLDNDCDGAVDEDATDVDGDGYTVEQGDCDDRDDSIYPDAAEICGDEVDNNCNSVVDEGCDEDTGFFPGCSIAGARGAPMGGIFGALVLLMPIILRRRSTS